ncbi:MAG: antirestriction protein ArdA [Alphaproteobacteria bacterium]|nr:antirestriction protein ArdA [Alphaproteobacteria bacterium]
MTNHEGDIRIYVACLAAYNNGVLHGRWIDAARDARDIHSDIQAMLKASPVPCAEEWAIHDYEGFNGVSISEYEGVEDVSKLAAFLTDTGGLGAALLAYCSDLETAQTAMENFYAGEYSSVADFAESLTEEANEVPESLRHYIDYERMGRDMELDSIFSIETGFEQVHIFWQH